MWRQLCNLRKLLQPAILNQSNAIREQLTNNQILRSFSLFSPSITTQDAFKTMMDPIKPQLLQPAAVSLNFERGFKVKGRLKRRCKDCYFVVRDERLYNICKTHPRHKQMAMKKKDKNTWILTDATQGKIRAW